MPLSSQETNEENTNAVASAWLAFSVVTRTIQYFCLLAGRIQFSSYVSDARIQFDTYQKNHKKS